MIAERRKYYYKKANCWSCTRFCSLRLALSSPGTLTKLVLYRGSTQAQGERPRTSYSIPLSVIYKMKMTPPISWGCSKNKIMYAKAQELCFCELLNFIELNFYVQKHTELCFSCHRHSLKHSYS